MRWHEEKKRGSMLGYLGGNGDPFLGGFIALWDGIESDPRKRCCAKRVSLAYGP